MKRLWLAAFGLLALIPGNALACAVCFGAADSKQTAGMNWAIFTLLGVIVAVLVSFAAFFFHLRRRFRIAAHELPVARELDRIEKEEEVLA